MLTSLAMVLAMAVVGGIGMGTANAAYPTGISSAEMRLNGDALTSSDVVKGGDTLGLHVVYNPQAKAQVVVFELTGGLEDWSVVNGSGVNNVPSGNTAIEKIEYSGTTLTVTFKDADFPNIPNGAFDLEVKVKDISTSGNQPLGWKVGTEPMTVTLKVISSTDTPRDVTVGYDKGVSPDGQSSRINIATVASDTVTLDSSTTTKEFDYTLVATSNGDKTSYTITDQLPPGFSYVAGSFSANIETWDVNGLNHESKVFSSFAPTPAAASGYASCAALGTGGNFSWTGDVKAADHHTGATDGWWVLTITYKAKITDTDTVKCLMQNAYNATTRDGTQGSFDKTFTNTATFGGTSNSAEADVRLSGTYPGTKPGSAFSKTGGWSATKYVPYTTGAVGPITTSYTLGASLAGLEGDAESYDPNAHTVVLKDSLEAGSVWSAATSADFNVTSTGANVFSLDSSPETTNCTATIVDFRTNTTEGAWCLTDSGRTLMINLGKSPQTAVTIQANVLISDLSAFTQTGTTQVDDGTPYRFRNSATFDYQGSSSYNTPNVDSKLVVLPEKTNEGLNDTSVFKKSAPGKEVSVEENKSKLIDYTFTIKTGNAIDPVTGNPSVVDPKNSYIVDYVDASVFDLSPAGLAAIKIDGTYDGVPLKLDDTHADYKISLSGSNELKIELTQSGKDALNAAASGAEWKITLSLLTKIFVGKQTMHVTNSATLFGGDGEPLYRDDIEASATSFGREAEVRKRIFDSQDWVAQMELPVNSANEPANDVLVYRIDYIPHNGFSNENLDAVVDTLPASVVFCGFLPDETAAESAAVTSPDCSALSTAKTLLGVGSNLYASYTSGSPENIAIDNEGGNFKDPGSPLSVFYAVTVHDASAPIVNTLTVLGVPLDEVTVTPKKPTPPVIPPAKTYAVGDYTWIDSNKNGVQDAGEPVLAGVTVELLDAKGTVINSTTTDAQGRYLFDELEAGTYQIRFTLTKDQAAKYTFTKADQGSDAKDSDANQATGLTKTFVLDDTNAALTKSYDRTIKATEGIDPTWDAGVIAASVSVGDYVWYDENGNGRQDKGEPGIEGVTMCLVGPDGKQVVDVNGKVVKPVKTDRDGKYTFENLPVLADGQSYTVCIDQAASKHALENYVPTKDGVGDRAGDSSTWTAKSQGLTKDGERDATLDFGFVRLEVEDEAVKTYAIGDYVWIDTVYNAVQDRAEKGLAGVTVELLNGKGKVLATTTTDARGYYLFDGLAAGKYQVRFTLTDEQAATYGFVMANRGSDDAIDSDGVVGRNNAVSVTAVFRLDDSNTALTKDYRRPIAASEGIDPTWDAGVASLDVLGAEELEPLPGDESEEKPTDTEDIAYTGVPTWSLLTLAMLLLAGGGALALGARRRGERQE